MRTFMAMSVKPRLIGIFGMLLLLCAVTVRAEGPTTTTTTTTTTVKHRGPVHRAINPAGLKAAHRDIDELKGDVDNLRREETDNVTAVQKIQHDIKVAMPPANAAPQTIGEHVAAVEKDLADTKKNLADNLGVHIHGLLDATYEYNLNHPGLQSGDRVNQFREFDTDANGFELTQFQLHIDRTVESGVGFVADINFGKTAEVLSTATRYSSGTESTNQVDPTQAYATYTVPVGSGINLSAGKFVTLLGAEVISTYNNLNYNESRGLLFTLGEPLTHTGLRANYAFNDKIALTMGVNNGWDDPDDNNDGKSVEGEIALTPTAAWSILLNGMYGPEQANHGNSKRGAMDPVITWKTPIPSVTLEGEYLYVHEDNPVAVTPLATGANEGINPLLTNPPCPSGPCVRHGVDWQGAAGYIVYDFNDKLELVTRGEYFRDSDGVRTGIRQSLGEVTFTINYKMVNGLLWRLEYRHDESNASPFYTNRGTPASFATLVNEGLLSPVYTISGQDTIEGAFIYSF
ncbi:MAG TPA: outer membrane beta-barrel protein [Candidatus Binataceae bacterium]|nr:outer membrane beta-barrel protein [Candidatus Binataceae bacterium]